MPTIAWVGPPPPARAARRCLRTRGFDVVRGAESSMRPTVCFTATGRPPAARDRRRRVDLAHRPAPWIRPARSRRSCAARTRSSRCKAADAVDQAAARLKELLGVPDPALPAPSHVVDRERGVARDRRAGRARGADLDAGADHRRDRHRQGSHGAADPRVVAARSRSGSCRSTARRSRTS